MKRFFVVASALLLALPVAAHARSGDVVQGGVGMTPRQAEHSAYILASVQCAFSGGTPSSYYRVVQPFANYQLVIQVHCSR